MKYWSSELKELVDVTLTSENTNISDSHRIKSVKGMKELLLDVRGSVSSPMFAIRQRTMAGMIIEWRAHNLLYALGIHRDRTGSVDLNLDVKPLYKIGYFVLSMLYFRF